VTAGSSNISSRTAERRTGPPRYCRNHRADCQRQKRRNIHVEIQQVMDRARIFGLAEPLERSPAGLGCAAAALSIAVSREATKALTVPCPPFAPAVASCRLALVYYLFSQFGILIHVGKVQDGQRHPPTSACRCGNPYRILISASGFNRQARRRLATLRHTRLMVSQTYNCIDQNGYAPLCHGT